MNPVLFGPKFIYYLFIYGRSLAAPCAAPLVEASHLSHQSDWSSAAPSSPRPPLVIFPWSPVASRGLPWPPVASRGLPWPPVASRDLPWPPVASRGFRCPVASHGLAYRICDTGYARHDMRYMICDTGYMRYRICDT